VMVAVVMVAVVMVAVVMVAVVMVAVVMVAVVMVAVVMVASETFEVTTQHCSLIRWILEPVMVAGISITATP